jgi:ubiquinone/menaquinone biosynthesis C-methylase UbiE
MPRDGAAAFDGAAAAELYDAARPGYPAAAIDWALPGRAQVVLDLGAGTGKLTAVLAGPGRRIIAVDPAAPMLDRLRQAHPQAETRIGTAERTGLAGSSVDAVVAGAAFHWFSRPAADAEIARVLRPGGTAALLWNPLDPGQSLFAPFADVRRRHGLPPAEYDPDIILNERWFEPTEHADFTHSEQITIDRYVEQLASRSYVLNLPEPARGEALAHARDVAAAHAVAGQVIVRYRTTVLRARRHSPRPPA